MTDLRSVLIESFAFDLWANRQWLAYYQSKSGVERAIEVLDHIVWAQLVWMERIEPKFIRPEGDAVAQMEAMNLAWTLLINDSDLAKVVEYQRFGGEVQKRTFGAIARHVADHGTYHRGQLRELAHSYGFEDFPEAGLSYFFQEQSLHED